ncbi:MAG: chemotaxis protein CheW [Thermodesulfobacteriota bacterium]|jgi:purine-binding chemotaxis protein CheW|nr:MAG: chemotaxis protein CheW [Thermodesulfobacteriota bacterium]
MSYHDDVSQLGGIKGGLADKAEKYLTFNLAAEEYGIEILKVQEIIGRMPVTKVPRTPPFIRGVINLRGKVIPVFDLRLKFGMEIKEDTPRTSIIVVKIKRSGHHMTMGVIVDDVYEVVGIEAKDIEPTPEFGANIDTDFILGVGKINQKVVMLLDVDKVLSGGEVTLVDQVTHVQEK